MVRGLGRLMSTISDAELFLRIKREAREWYASNSLTQQYLQRNDFAHFLELTIESIARVDFIAESVKVIKVRSQQNIKKAEAKLKEYRKTLKKQPKNDESAKKQLEDVDSLLAGFNNFKKDMRDEAKRSIREETSILRNVQ